MAQPAYKQKPNSAKFVTVAHQINGWAYKWCKDERLFGRRERWMIAGELWKQAVRLLLDVREGNRRKGLKDDAIYAARRGYFEDALDAIECISTLLTLKYHHIQEGFDALKQAEEARAMAAAAKAATAPPAPPPTAEPPGGAPATWKTEGPAKPTAGLVPDAGRSKKKPNRGGKTKLTQDDIDRAFCVVCDLLDEEERLIHGLIASDAKRREEEKAEREVSF